MSTPADTTVLEEEIRRLESRVEILLRECIRLREENTSLRGRQDQLVTDRAGLIERNDRARTRVESMINRLKLMEHSA